MKTQFLVLFFWVCLCSCDNSGKESNQVNAAEEIPITSEATDGQFTDGQLVETMATVLSVQEELIMPADYLTTAMTVKTSSNDTLVFLNMGGLEGLVNREITLRYQLESSTSYLVCFDCSSYAKKFRKDDVSTILSDVSFERLKLKECILDPYFTPEMALLTADYHMEKENGEVEHFFSEEPTLIEDSVAMKDAFHDYGVIRMFTPTLVNKEELVELSK